MVKKFQDLASGCQESIKHLSEKQREFVIILTQEYGEWWEETIEYVENNSLKKIERKIRYLRRHGN
jgi:hypothetical protein